MVVFLAVITLGVALLVLGGLVSLGEGYLVDVLAGLLFLAGGTLVTLAVLFALLFLVRSWIFPERSARKPGYLRRGFT